MPLRLTSYRALKDRLLGPPGTPEREQFEQELARELAALKRQQTGRKPRCPGQ